MKQATHTSHDQTGFTIMDGTHGGFVVGDRNEFAPFNMLAAFSTAEECGAWVTQALKNVTHKKFGAKKS